jgi:uncharacterized membrane protein YkoI
MAFRSLLLGAALATALTGAFAPAARAQSLEPEWAAPRRARALLDVAEARVRPLREIVAMVRAQRGGDLVDVLRLEQRAEPPFYVLRWRYPNGRIEDLRVNAVTGRVLG